MAVYSRALSFSALHSLKINLKNLNGMDSKISLPILSRTFPAKCQMNNQMDCKTGE
uniref:Uncharacterized protein n=1 Tax=Anguilla anguilla TaxID=7936 RepID=A0A0E9WDW7_ANGAN